jgi:hypothetical protein
MEKVRETVNDEKNKETEAAERNIKHTEEERVTKR